MFKAVRFSFLLSFVCVSMASASGDLATSYDSMALKEYKDCLDASQKELSRDEQNTVFSMFQYMRKLPTYGGDQSQTDVEFDKMLKSTNDQLTLAWIKASPKAALRIEAALVEYNLRRALHKSLGHRSIERTYGTVDAKDIDPQIRHFFGLVDRIFLQQEVVSSETVEVERKKFLAYLVEKAPEWRDRDILESNQDPRPPSLLRGNPVPPPITLGRGILDENAYASVIAGVNNLSYLMIRTELENIDVQNNLSGYRKAWWQMQSMKWGGRAVFVSTFFLAPYAARGKEFGGAILGAYGGAGAKAAEIGSAVLAEAEEASNLFGTPFQCELQRVTSKQEIKRELSEAALSGAAIGATLYSGYRFSSLFGKAGARSYVYLMMGAGVTATAYQASAVYSSWQKIKLLDTLTIQLGSMKTPDPQGRREKVIKDLNEYRISLASQVAKEKELLLFSGLLSQQYFAKHVSRTRVYGEVQSVLLHIKAGNYAKVGEMALYSADSAPVVVESLQSMYKTIKSVFSTPNSTGVSEVAKGDAKLAALMKEVQDIIRQNQITYHQLMLKGTP